MLLRSLTKHVRDQNWFAVALDFFIVVVGILIAFQITNWNEARTADAREKAILLQLDEEFTEIRSSIIAQNTIREGYLDAFSALITTLEGSGPAADDWERLLRLPATRPTRAGSLLAFWSAAVDSGAWGVPMCRNSKNVLCEFSKCCFRHDGNAGGGASW